MAVYNMDKIKEWYDDFNSCKSSYLNNHYQAYKSSYVVNNGDPATNKMQEKLDTYYSRLKKAYSKVGTQWKNLYSDLMNADAALAGQKSSGSLNSSSASAKISAMPKLIEYKNVLQMSALTKAAVASMVTGANISTQGMSDLAVESNGSSNSSNISEMTATGAILGATIASIVPGLGTAVGAVLGAATGALVGSGIVSKVKDWLVGTGQTIKETAINVKNKVGSIVNSVKNTEDTLDKIKVIGSGAKQIGKKFAATGATIATSAVEGIYKLLEDAVDLVALAGAAVASVGTGTVDLVNAAKAKVSGDSSFKSNYTKQMWEKTRSFVSTDFVGNVFDSFYEDTPAGQWIKNNSIGFDTTRAITKEVSEVIGVVALSTVTGGGAAVMYGAAKVAEHTESNWQDENTSTAKGLLKGTLQGVADGAFFAIGAKGDAALKTAAEATSKTALKSAGIEVAENASKKALQESLKGLSKESVKVLGKDLSKMLAKKTAFECATSVAQDLGTIGIDTIISNDTVTDTNGNIIKLNSLSEKWNYYYKQAGGVQGLAQSMLTAGILSGLSDTVDTTQLLKGAKQVQKQANKVAFKSAASAVKDDILDSVTKVKNKLDSSTLKQKVSDSVSNTKSKLQSANLKTSYKLDQLKASANVKLVNGGLYAADKIIGLKNAIKNFGGDTISKVKNKLDSSTLKQKVSDSVSNTKSKLQSANLKTSYKLEQLKTSANLKLTKTKISAASKVVNLGLAIKNLTGDTISKVKNKVDLSSVKQKVSDSVSNTKSKISTVKSVVGEISSNVTEYSKNKLKNVNLKLKNSLSNTKFKLSTGVAKLSGTAISLKNKLKASIDDTVKKINVKNQAKYNVKSEIKDTINPTNVLKSQNYNLPDSVVELLDVNDIYNRYGRLNDSNRKSIQDVFRKFNNQIQNENIGNQNFVEYILNNGNVSDVPDFLKFFNEIDENASIGHLTVNEAIAVYNYTVGSSNLQAFVGNNDVWSPPNPYNIPYASVKTPQEAVLNKKYLDSALSKGTVLKNDQIFYSGMSSQKLKLWGIGNGDINSVYSNLKNKVGKNLNTIKNYISTSPTKNGAFDDKEVLWRIKGKKGQQIGSYINEISAYSSSDMEYEFLMKRNLTMKVQNVTIENGKIIADLEIVN